VLASLALSASIRDAIEKRDHATEGHHEREHDKTRRHLFRLANEIAKVTAAAQMVKPTIAVASENGRSLRKLPNINAPPPTFAISRSVSANNVRCCGSNSNIAIHGFTMCTAQKRE
jgi:hypothetical protein